MESLEGADAQAAPSEIVAQLQLRVSELEQSTAPSRASGESSFEGVLNWLVPSLLAAIASAVVCLAVFLPDDARTELAMKATASGRGGPVDATGLIDGDLQSTGAAIDEQVDPHVVIDLGGIEYFDEIVVVNRTDCCQDAALPIVAELSLDGVTYGELARRGRAYDKWTIERSSRARFLRFTALGRHALHLSEVQVIRE
jgi:hypothetical protein